MITERDLIEAISECLGKRDPDANTCIKLAAFYTIKNELFPSEDPQQPERGYSYASGPEDDREKITIDSDTEFAHAIDGKRQGDVWPVIDELMETIKAIYPRLYKAVLARF